MDATRYTIPRLKLVARAGVEPASAAFQTAAETASATRPLANLVEPIGVEPISPACKAGALPYELRSRLRLGGAYRHRTDLRSALLMRRARPALPRLVYFRRTRSYQRGGHCSSRHFPSSKGWRPFTSRKWRDQSRASGTCRRCLPSRSQHHTSLCWHSRR
jgi:hypothetical protein